MSTNFVLVDKRTREDLIHACAGASSAVIAAGFVCPLDLVKTRLQVHGLPPSSPPRNVIYTSLKEIVKNEGIRGMYRGLSPTIIALIPTWAVYFTVYEKLKTVLHSNADASDQLSVSNNIIAATGAGVTSAVVTNPLWVVKTRFMTHGLRPGEVPYRRPLSLLKSILYEEGFRGLYSGVLPSLLGVSHAAIQFPAFEVLKSYFARMENTTLDKLSVGNVAVASSISKLLASTITYPHEVVRSKLQDQTYGKSSMNNYSSFVDCVKKVFRKEGLPGLYSGYLTNLVRTIPTNMITLTSYELIKRYLCVRFLPEQDYASVD